ncbi:MAG TPA: hypothetical protein PK093_05565 [Phycisphaerae bacterium]|nr:hypothetical protein [Phycisphaerae bacterium]
MKTIQASINTRLLKKADRLFTGTLAGRIIEILQNARRAGATRVEVSNRGGQVTVLDNGDGIDDFSTLLDLGGSGWADELDTSEDPAGVGLFCLAPRRVVVRSNRQTATLEPGAWTGSPVEVRDAPSSGVGTMIEFADDPWTHGAVQPHAVFCGMEVIVDGQPCGCERFTADTASHHPELGCRIEVRENRSLSAWHRLAHSERYGANVIVNFHGQVVAFAHHPISEHSLHYLIDLTGETTGIRLMLPARTRLVENDAYHQLLSAIELEAFRFLRRRGEHRLPYIKYTRSLELGVQLSEATPTFTVGLISAVEGPEPVEVTMPDGHPLDRCYRLSDELAKSEEFAETNVHLLASLGRFDVPFVPVTIHHNYDGYQWADLPTIDRIEVKSGKILHSDGLWSGELYCVDAITITAHASDGRVLSSPVCMAIRTTPPPEGPTWCAEHVLVTPDARSRLHPAEIWHHLGGWCDEGDRYETQEYEFEQDLSRFWADLIGPDEHLRQSILEVLSRVPGDWREVTVYRPGIVNIQLADGTNKALLPPSDQ